MKNLFKILFSLTLLLATFSCEKEIIAPNDMDNFGNRSSIGCSTDCVTDPDEDEDFDGIEDKVIANVTDPDEDEDFDSEELGTQN